jgi:hypothetical protein
MQRSLHGRANRNSQLPTSRLPTPDDQLRRPRDAGAGQNAQLELRSCVFVACVVHKCTRSKITQSKEDEQMKRVTTMCVAVALGWAVATAAQTQQSGESNSPGVSQPQTQQQPASPPSDREQARPTTQKPAEPSTQKPAEIRGAANTTSFIGCVEKGSAPEQWVLNVTEMPSGDQPRAGAGTAATAGASMVGQKVQLSGGTNVSAHAGHKVEITGMLTPAAGATPGRPAEPRMTVSNLKMISATCTPATAAPRSGPSGTSGTSSPGTTGTTGASEPSPATPSPAAPPQPEQQKAPDRQQQQ